MGRGKFECIRQQMAELEPVDVVVGATNDTHYHTAVEKALCTLCQDSRALIADSDTQVR